MALAIFSSVSVCKCQKNAFLGAGSFPCDHGKNDVLDLFNGTQILRSCAGQRENGQFLSDVLLGYQ